MKKNSINLLSSKLKYLAEMQWKDYQNGTPSSFFGKYENDLTVKEAYAVQTELSRLRCLSGDNIIGYKVGCIGSGVVEQFGIAGPVYGRIFHKELYVSGKKLIYKNFSNLAIEGEMAIILDKDLKISNAFPVIELHNFIFQAKSKTLTELIANNAINAGVVISDKSKFKPINQWTSSQILSVKVNDKIIDSGKLWAMQGGAEESVNWLHQILNRHGISLKPGNIILTGTSLSLYQVKCGDNIRVFVDKDELVSCEVL